MCHVYRIYRSFELSILKPNYMKARIIICRRKNLFSDKNIIKLYQLNIWQQTNRIFILI